MEFRVFLGIAVGVATVSMAGCGGGSEPALPTFNPLDKVVKRKDGWKINYVLAIDPEKNLYHVRHLVTGQHKIDAKSKPLSLTPIKASCRVAKPASTDRKFVVIAETASRNKGQRLQPSLTVFSKSRLETEAKITAARLRKDPGTLSFGGPGFEVPREMAIFDVIVTESEKPAFVVLSGDSRTLYNFSVSPYAKISGVLVFTNDETAAVAGLDPSVPVYFQSAVNPMTKRCFMRVQQQPDETWKDHRKVERGEIGGADRYRAVMPHYKKFAAKVRRDVGSFGKKDLLSIRETSVVLLGPAPTQLEQRIPYSSIAGSHIRYLQSDYMNYGSYKENKVYIDKTINQRAQEIVAGK